MALKAFTKAFLSFYRFLFRRRGRSGHAPHAKLQKYPSMEKLSSCKTLVVDVEEGLLRSSSMFPYFMLVALEAGGWLFLRGLVLLLLYPLLCLLGEEVGVKVMVFVCFCGLRKEGLRVGRAVLPKFFLEEVGLEGFEVMMRWMRGRERGVVCVSRMPRVMVEGFLKEYLEVEVVVGRELKVFGGFYTGFLEEDLFGDEEDEGFVNGGDVLGFVGSCSSKSLHHHFLSHCKEIYRVTEWERKRWQPLPRSQYPRPLIFHDGRIAFLPTPLAALTMFLWLPLAIPLSLSRVLLFSLFPYKLSLPLVTLSGLTTCNSLHTHTHTQKTSQYRLYVCNHRTLLDPVYVSAALNKPLTAVTYSLSPISEILSPIPTVRLTRNKEEDRRRMKRFLSTGDLVVCPEGTTCREPYLLRFSPLFAELTDEIVPVAVVATAGMFYGTTAGGSKWMDPFCFLMNPKPEYDVKFLETVKTRGSEEGRSSYEVANRVQGEIGRALGFQCTALTRKDKYLMLAGNEGIVRSGD